jgi:putative Holliday junction resolvase
MNFLGLDLGTVTCGVAYANQTILAEHLTTIRFAEKDFPTCLKEVQKLIDKYRINVVVLGLPISLNNTLGAQAQLVLTFYDQLCLIPGITVEKEDERFTTAEAIQRLKSYKLADSKRLRDEVAAELILQSYLDRVYG